MQYHELSQKLTSFIKDSDDKIIRDWLLDKCKKWQPVSYSTEMLNHFGLTKTTCECGATKWSELTDEWLFSSSIGRIYFSSDFKHCPACGDKLGE